MRKNKENVVFKAWETPSATRTWNNIEVKKYSENYIWQWRKKFLSRNLENSFFFSEENATSLIIEKWDAKEF